MISSSNFYDQEIYKEFMEALKRKPSDSFAFYAFKSKKCQNDDQAMKSYSWEVQFGLT